MITTILATTLAVSLAISFAVSKSVQRERNRIRIAIRCFCGAACIAMGLWNSLGAAEYGVPEPIRTHDPAAKSVSEVKDQVRTLYLSYRAIEVQYVQQVRHDPPAKGVIPRMKYTYAYKGERRLKQEQPLVDASEQPQVSYTFAYNGDVQQQYCNEPSQLTIYKRKEQFTDIDAYISVLGIPMQNTERATASKNPQLLPGCLDIGEWKVRPMLEAIDDYKCHVLTSSMGHRLWVDASQGVVRFRETSIPDAANDPADWPINERFYYSEYTQCADGILLPKLVKVDSYSATKASEQKVVRQHFFAVERIRVNDDVSAELFTLKVPDGTVVNDMINTKFFKVGDSERSLEKLVTLQERRNGGVSLRLMLWITNAVALCAGIFFWRRHSKVTKTSSGTGPMLS